MKDNELHFGAKPSLFDKAKELRRTMTEAEQYLWKYLRNRRLSGLKFRRQHPIDRFIADFYCHEFKLVVEVDGGIHETKERKEYDIGRTHELEKFEINVIRFKNEEVLNSIEMVLEAIQSKINNENSLGEDIGEVKKMAGSE